MKVVMPVWPWLPSAGADPRRGLRSRLQPNRQVKAEERV